MHSTFGEIIRQLRENKKVTQSELADLLNIERQTYSAYERNISTPNIENISRLADYFDVTCDYLIGRTTYRNPMNSISATKIQNSPFVQGSGAVIISGQSHSLSVEVTELVKIYESLNARERHKLLDYAFKLEQAE